KQFCNLTTINAETVVSQDDLNKRTAAAAVIGTLQASYTDFPDALSDGWREQTEDEALLGVSMTGIASGRVDHLDLGEAASHAVATNRVLAEALGINPAARVTTIKPEGTASLVAGTSSGIHAWHDHYFIRRVRYNRDESIARYLMENLPYRPEHDPDNPEIVEDDKANPGDIVLSIPQAAPEGAVTRHEGAIPMLERVRKYTREWIKPGNVYGGQMNNVSATVNIKDEEWDQVRDWMWNNRYEYNGLALMPYSDHSYVQAPYESISREKYEELSARVGAVDLTEIDEVEDHTDLSGELACAGGACDLPWL
ncbi:MAG: hypothetical protein LC687_07675, partial [Actinobacteria bacterium]|nr:hypothetical protein [Actinomycetota bacterium]